MVSVLSRFLLLLALAALSVAARAQEIPLSLTVNYGSAYRNGAWTPVDVIAQNRGPAVKGDLSVVIYNPVNEPQSPIQHIPVDLPNNSNKRFRFTCRLNNVDHIEVTLSDGRRIIGGGALRIPLPPINKDDLLGLLLDERPEDYGFLSDLYTGEHAPRFFRESLNMEQIAALSENPRCYDAFDVIVLGDTDPGRFSDGQRTALDRFVNEGGTLVVLTGAQGAVYHGTWVEQLAGVEIGEIAYAPAHEFASKALGESKAVGAAADASCSFAKLTPRDKGVKRLGGDAVLATLATVGRGRVVVFANDQKTRAMEQCAGYLQVWREAARRRADVPEMNWQRAASFSSATMPALAGVSLLPRSSVLTYLLVYFLVAVVANWAFWTWRKRREFAWVCLVLFSFAFTAYAMFYGTAGRAQKSQLFQFDVVQAPASAGSARVESIAGVVSSGSARYAPALPLPHSSVADLSAEFPGMGDPFAYRRGAASIAPCKFIEGDPPTLQDVRIGASDLRVLRIASDTELDGGIEGTLHIENGVPTGIFENHTGHRLTGPTLYYAGHRYPLEHWEENKLSVLPAESARYDPADSYQDYAMRGYSYAYRTRDADGTPGLKMKDVITPFIQQIVLNTPDDYTAVYGVQRMSQRTPIFRNLPPLIFAEMDRAVTPALDAGPLIEFKGGTSILVAAVKLDVEGQVGVTGNDLVIDTSNASFGGRVQRMQGGQWRQVADPQQRAEAWRAEADEIMSGSAMGPRIHAVPGGFPAPIASAKVDVYWEKAGGELELRAGKDNRSVLSAEELPDELLLDRTLRHRRFTLPDDDIAAMESDGLTQLELHYNATDDSRNRRAHVAFTMECHVEYQQPEPVRKEPIAWQ